jgi:hypothetical protein
VAHNLQRHPYATVTNLCTSHIHGPRYLNTMLLLTHSHLPPTLPLHLTDEVPTKTSRKPNTCYGSLETTIHTHVTLTQVEPNLQRHPYATSPTCGIPTYIAHVRLPPVEHNLQRHRYATVTHTRPTSVYHRWSITSNVTHTPRSPTCARHTYMAHVIFTPCSYSHTPNHLQIHPYTLLMKYPL